MIGNCSREWPASAPITTSKAENLVASLPSSSVCHVCVVMDLKRHSSLPPRPMSRQIYSLVVCYNSQRNL
eukprot:scaffold101847_cov19-Prasinocladus_malaysianus.AAC.1